MALKHDFFLIPNTVDLDQLVMNYNKHSDIIDSVVLHDDIISYMSDTLKWIPSKNPGLRGITPCKGINYHGVTLFDSESAPILKSVFSAWKDLFQNSPKVLKLTGMYVMIEGVEGEGHYEKLVFNRDELIKNFEKMISFSNQLAEGNCYIYHWGV
ncbi:hypothetical protein ACFYKT_13640 [Cytobacillus sp. FJAT-53684]|uniref:Uncharacterized protein n=1 Tax=Cytobacillus mangrovibacter TaxID=3299024 RepID=A0ABW6K342_9BACI